MPSMWDERFAEEGFAYGDNPNEFLASVAYRIPPGPVLCLCEGQGRNAVYLATRGHDVTAHDGSAVGLRRASELAAARGVRLTTVCCDLAALDLGVHQWSAVVSIFAHAPSALRRSVHASLQTALRPGGVFVLEAYAPAQAARDTGGPKDRDLLMAADEVRVELVGLTVIECRELIRPVVEGRYHTGEAVVTQVLATA